MFVINATTCNGCRLEVLNFGALNVVCNTWVFLGFFTYEIWAEFKKSCGNTANNVASNICHIEISEMWSKL